jgi:Gnt-I system low-affinity gluconate transporter
MSTTALLLIAAAGVALLLVLVVWLKLQAFVALLLVSFIVALVAGIPLGDTVSTIVNGMGDTLGFVAIVVGLGVMIGQIIQVSGGAQRVAFTLIERFGEQRAPLALGITGFIVAIPVFFDVGLIILIPLAYAIARRLSRSLIYYAIPLLAGLAVTHAAIPPTPGPVAVAGIIGADLGWVIIFGLVCGIPAFLVGGYLFGQWLGGRMPVDVPQYMIEEVEEEQEDPEHAPPFGLVVGLILLPLVLILSSTMSDVTLPEGSGLRTFLNFIGDPVTALLLAVLLTFYVLAVRRGWSRDRVLEIATAALEPVGLIVLVTGAGGVFGAVLEEAGIGTALENALDASGLPLVAAAFLIALAVRVAIGSATAASVTSAGIIAPLLQGQDISAPLLGLLVIVIAAGATALSHVNDSGFWLVNRFLGLSEADTLKSWTVMETLLGFSMFAVALVVSFFL